MNNNGWPWKYSKQDPEKIAQESYLQHQHNGCMYAVFYSIVNQVNKQNGKQDFPYEMMLYGRGGLAGTRYVCGAVNGAAAAIGLFVSDADMRTSLIQNLILWHDNTSLPKFEPAEPMYDQKPVVSSVSGSANCDLSLLQWEKAAGTKAGDNESKERCARIVADVTAKTVEMLNSIK